MRRAKVSTPPPGDTGTTMRIGRLGKTACARTIPGASTTPAVARSDEIASRRFVEMVLNWMPFPLVLSRAEPATFARSDVTAVSACPLHAKRRHWERSHKSALTTRVPRRALDSNRSKPKVRGAEVHFLRLARGRSIAGAVVGGAQERAALDDAAR